jgi:hypothetical protein
VSQPNRKKEYYKSYLPKNEEIGGIFVFSVAELFSKFKIKINIKKL